MTNTNEYSLKTACIARVVNVRVDGCNVSADVTGDEMGNAHVNVTVTRKERTATVEGIDMDTKTYGDLACCIADAYNDETGDCIADAFGRVGAVHPYTGASKLAQHLAVVAVDALRDEIARGNRTVSEAVRAGAMRGAFGSFVLANC